MAKWNNAVVSTDIKKTYQSTTGFNLQMHITIAKNAHRISASQFCSIIYGSWHSVVGTYKYYIHIIRP